MSEYRLIHGDCQDVLLGSVGSTFDLCLCDPPYPCIDRSYGRWTEAEWFTMMRRVVPECMRVLKPSGSAVFILQPNSERVGKMRTWLWEFMLWVGKEWGIVQDAYWWNHTSMPTLHTAEEYGLLRPSLKTCVWVGPEDCHRNQPAVWWEPSQTTKAWDLESRAMRINPSGVHNRSGRACATAIERGGAVPFNVLPIANSNSATSAGANGHGAGTPLALCDWWVRYLTPPGGVVLDPFAGTATVGIAALKHGHSFTGIECFAEYIPMAERRLAEPAAVLVAEQLFFSAEKVPQPCLFGEEE